MSEGYDYNYGTPQNQDGYKSNSGGGSWMAVVSLILGIISIVLCCIWYISLIAGVVSIVLAILYNKNNGRNGMSTAGLVCSIIGIILAIAIIVIAALGIAALGGLSALEAYQ